METDDNELKRLQRAYDENRVAVANLEAALNAYKERKKRLCANCNAWQVAFRCGGCAFDHCGGCAGLSLI